jgi:hypothetical protein
MRIADHLSPEQKKQLDKMKSPPEKKRKTKVQPKPKSKKQESVNWPEIMGMNRDRFYRGRGGAFKSK